MTTVTSISSATINACPLRSLAAGHYRTDGTCRCRATAPPREAGR